MNELALKGRTVGLLPAAWLYFYATLKRAGATSGTAERIGNGRWAGEKEGGRFPGTPILSTFT